MLRKEMAMDVFEALKDLPEAPSVLRAWLWKMEREGLLEKLFEKISLAGLGDGKESLAFLLRLSKEVGADRESAVACCDMEGENQILRRIRDLLREPKGTNKNTFMVLGAISHNIMPLIVSGELFRRKKRRSLRSGRQLEIFWRAKSSQAELFGENEIGPTSDFLDTDSPVSLSFSRVSALWERVLRKAQKYGYEWPAWGFANSRELEELFVIFTPLFRNYANLFRKLWRKGEDSFAVAAMMMSLASAMIHFRREKEKGAFFPEVPILDFTRHGLSGGRADVIRVSSDIGDFSKSEKAVADRIKAYHRVYGFKSFGDLLSAFEGFGSPLKFDIVDWKFAIGDVFKFGGSRPQVTNPNTLKLPLQANVEQMKRYMSLSSLSTHFHDPGKYPLDWDDGAKKATLCYFHPFSQPLMFNVEMRAEEKKSSFLQQIVEAWESLQKTAELRNFNNALCRQLLPVLKGQEDHRNGNGKTANGSGKERTQTQPLFDDPQIARPILKIVREFKDDALEQSFVDELKLIRKVKQKDGSETLLMDFSRLLDAISEGKAVTRGITARGGFISCIMPGHEERTPSFHVSPEKRVFKCFGCGAYGKLVNIPKEILVELPIGASLGVKGFPLRSEIKKLVIPEKHHLVMNTAQEILQSKFRGSEAERYLQKERLIDSDFAFSFGAGYGDDALINGLMDWGLFLDELYSYGFVDFSPKLSPFRGIGPLLVKRGFASDRMKRDIKTIKIIDGKKKVVPVTGYPFSSLGRRATFPLTLTGKCTSFYGRAAYQCDKSFSHRKLKAENVPQGGFNMGALDTETKEIFVVESVIDGLSLMSIMNNRSAISVIGVDNYIVLDLVAESGKKINLALNNDVPDSKGNLGSGQKATQKIIERFGKRGIGVEDLTPMMLAPTGLNDYNDLLRQMVREKQKHND